MPKNEVVRSLFDTKVTAEVDTFSDNGPAAEYLVSWPDDFKIAARVRAGGWGNNPQLPKMFAGGKQDLPTVTASGIDPSALKQVPYRVRHAIAAEPNQARAYSMIEQYSDDPFAEIDHEGLRAAVARVKEWANIPADQLTEDEQSAMYERIMGPRSQEEKDRVAKVQEFESRQAELHPDAFIYRH